MKASILAVGTEITLGQINNSNASNLAQKLSQHGIETNLHLSVPDEKELILNALNFCLQKSQILVITGGLGPTSDDFTRDVIGSWVNEPMEFYQPTFDKIQQRLKERGLAIREMQKQQCYYPKGAQVLANSNGTADGFYLFKKSIHIFVLPGPPTEIEAIWNEHMKQIIKDLTLNLDPVLLKSWNVLAISEQELAHKLEPLFLPYQNKINFNTGYRINLPYNEFKITYNKSNETQIEPLFNQITQTLSDYFVLQNGADLADQFVKILDSLSKQDSYKNKPFFIEDHVTHGYLFQRLQAASKKQNINQNIIYCLNNSYPKMRIENSINHQSDCILSLKLNWQDSQLALKISNKKGDFEYLIPSPYKNPQSILDRYIKYLTEMTLIKTLDLSQKHLE